MGGWAGYWIMGVSHVPVPPIDRRAPSYGKFRSVFGRVWEINGGTGSSGSSSREDRGLGHQEI